MKLTNKSGSILIISIIIIIIIFGMITYLSKLTFDNLKISKINYLNSVSSQNSKSAANNFAEQLLNLSPNILIVDLTSKNIICTYNNNTSTCNRNDISILNAKTLLQIPINTTIELQTTSYLISSSLSEIYQTLKISATTGQQTTNQIVSINNICPSGTLALTLAQINNLDPSYNKLFPNIYCACRIGNMDLDSGECKCATGTYLNAGACQSCPAGTFSSAGANACSLCPLGYFSLTGSSNCSPNTAENCKLKSNVENKCLSCLAGYGFSNGNCTQCPGGGYSIGDTSICLPCNNNYYSLAGSGICQQNTAPNCYTRSKTANECSSCIAGFGFNSETKNCIECQPGQYSTEGNNTTCQACQENTFSETSKATYCSPNTALNCIIKSKTTNKCQTCNVQAGYGFADYGYGCFFCRDFSRGARHYYADVSTSWCAFKDGDIPHCVEYSLNEYRCAKCDVKAGYGFADYGYGCHYCPSFSKNSKWYYADQNTGWCNFQEGDVPYCGEYSINSPGCAVCYYGNILHQDNFYLYQGKCYKCPYCLPCFARNLSGRCQCPNGINVFKDYFRDGLILLNTHDLSRMLENRAPTDQAYWDENCSG